MSGDPKSTAVPTGGGGAGGYIVGFLVLAGLVGALLYYKGCGEEETKPEPTAENEATTAEPEAPVMKHAPPPPPEIEEEEEEEEEAPTGDTTAKVGTTGSGSAGMCSNCKGKATSALQSALSGAAGTARGCYQRAIQNSAVEGKMMVSVTVGSTGSVCGAKITQDTVGSQEVSSCVLSRFQGQSFPAPEGGCLTANIPISFQVK